MHRLLYYLQPLLGRDLVKLILLYILSRYYQLKWSYLSGKVSLHWNVAMSGLSVVTTNLGKALCSTDGRAVASENWDLQFESSHRQHLFTVDWKITQPKRDRQKRPFLKKLRNYIWKSVPQFDFKMGPCSQPLPGIC